MIVKSGQVWTIQTEGKIDFPNFKKYCDEYDLIYEKALAGLSFKIPQERTVLVTWGIPFEPKSMTKLWIVPVHTSPEVSGWRSNLDVEVPCHFRNDFPTVDRSIVLETWNCVPIPKGSLYSWIGTVPEKEVEKIHKMTGDVIFRSKGDADHLSRTQLDELMKYRGESSEHLQALTNITRIADAMFY